MNFRWLIASSLLVLTLLGAGCDSWPGFKPPVEDVKPVRKARSSQLAKEYEKKRNDAQYLAAVSVWKQGNSETCREMVDSLLGRDPEHRGGRLLRVQLHLLEQELKEAREEVGKLAEDFPDDAEVLHVQGLVCETNGQPEQAEKCYRRAVEIDPDNELFVASLACLLEGEPEDADALATDSRSTGETSKLKPRKRVPAGPETNRLSAALLKAEVHLALGEREVARRLVEKVSTSTPENAELNSLLSRIRAPPETPNDPKVQPASYRQTSNRIHLKRGDDEGNPPPSFQAATASVAVSAAVKSPGATRSNSSIEETLRCGENALAADKPTAARSYFQRAIATAPDDESVAVNAAVASLRHDQSELAAELAQSSLSRWPKSAALYRTLGMAEYRLEHWQAAQAALRQSLSLDNSHALSYFLLGCTLSKLGQNEEAERNFNQARQLDTRYALKP